MKITIFNEQEKNEVLKIDFKYRSVFPLPPIDPSHDNGRNVSSEDGYQVPTRAQYRVHTSAQNAQDGCVAQLSMNTLEAMRPTRKLREQATNLVKITNARLMEETRTIPDNTSRLDAC